MVVPTVTETRRHGQGSLRPSPAATVDRTPPLPPRAGATQAVAGYNLTSPVSRSRGNGSSCGGTPGSSSHDANASPSRP